jgi:hypothetical protein
MADTGAPWELPYPLNTDLVRDGADAIKALAEATADGLDDLDTAIDNIPVLAGIGSNVVTAITRNAFATTGTTFAEITGLTATITPSSATSKVLIIAYVRYSNTSSSDNSFLALFRDSTNINGTIDSGSRFAATTDVYDATMVLLDSPETTSPITYGVRLASGSAGGTAVANRRGAGGVEGTCTLTVIEVAP